MGHYNRSIKIAFDKLSGEVLDADEVFDITKDAFQIRKQYHEKNLLLSCCECEQDLMVSNSKYDRLHFKHKPGHDYCIFADDRLTPQEHERFTAILKSKESNRHKELKNKIGDFLKAIPEVDKDSISIDKKFIIKGNEKRRPDVYCKYKNKELVFEIQLSNLSLGYILSRYEFYKKHGMYLIWILDNFDIHNQGTLEKDIKYLTKYENFFKLDEEADTLKLECEYKFPFLTSDNKLLTKWLKKSVSLDEVNFDEEIFQIYHYNFGDNRNKIELIQKKKQEEIKEEERRAFQLAQLEKANSKSQKIINEIKKFRDEKRQDFSSIKYQLTELDEYEIVVLNRKLNLKNRLSQNSPPLIKWIDEATKVDIAFLEFILNSKQIELDINALDSIGRTALQAIIANKNIYRAVAIQQLFRAYYKITESDIIYLSKLIEVDKTIEDDVEIYKFYNRLTDRELVGKVFRYSKLLFIIESAKRQQIIGFNYKQDEWIAFANNAIQYHSDYWEYIELSFKRYGLWEKLIQVDKKGTFQKKISTFYSTMPQQKYDIDDVFNDLYPDLEDYISNY